MKSFKLIETNTKQMTIDLAIEMSGFSAYSKEMCKAIFSPAPCDTGIVFRVNDMEIKAVIGNLKDDGYTHTTSLTSNGVEVKTIEHIISAIRGMGIDNIYIDLCNGQVPFLSSSSEEFCRFLANAGLKQQEQAQNAITCTNEVEITYESTDTHIRVIPSDYYEISATIDFNNLIGKQSYSVVVNKENYLGYIAPSRSFMRSELDDEGVAWQNVKKIFPGISDDPSLSPIIVFNKDKFITPLKNETELVRHKILDMIGDLGLVGAALIGRFEVLKPGHEANKHLANHILNQLDKDERVKLL